jgi:hypothetical protein
LETPRPPQRTKSQVIMDTLKIVHIDRRIFEFDTEPLALNKKYNNNAATPDPFKALILLE